MSSVSSSSVHPDTLERTHILKEILEHVEEYAKKFDKVDYSALRDQILKPVLEETFDPEIQIRGFLNTFKHTSAYKDAFSNIPDDLKEQVNDFVHGKPADKVVEGHDLHLTAHKSPPVEHHFSLLTQLKKWLLCGSDIKEAVEDARHPKHKHVKGLPILYENSTGSQVVEVCCRPVRC